MEVKEIREFLGLETPEDGSIDELKQEFNNKFLTFEDAKENSDIAAHHVGKRMGSASREIIRKAKELGAEFEDGELKGEDGKELPVEKLAEKSLSKIREALGSEIEELKNKQSKTNDNKVKDLEEKLNAANKRLEEEQSAKKEISETLESEQQKFQNEMKSFKVNSRLKDIKSNMRFVDDLKSVHFKGLDAELQENYQFDLDEKENLIVTDKEGNRIQNPDKAGDYLGAEDVVTKVADENGLLKKNNGGEQQPHQQEPQQPQQPANNNHTRKPRQAIA